MTDAVDILIAGAGPAGMAAAICAAESGARVALVDDNPAPGGQIWRSGAEQPLSAREWLARLQNAAVVRLQGWRIIDQPARGILRSEQQGTGKCADIGYKNLILATGARERFLPFPGWTLPNIMGAGGLDAMVRAGLPITGKRVVVAGTGPLLLAAAAHLAEAGAKIVAICEQAPLRRFAPFALHLLRQPGKVGQGIAMLLAARRAKIHTRCWVLSARGSDKVESVTLHQPGRVWDVACDYVACGFHLVPNLELPLLVGCRIHDGFVEVDALQRTSLTDVFCAGEPTGIGGVERALLEGQIAGLAAAGRTEEARRIARSRKASDGFVRALSAVTVLDPELRKLPADSTFVCRCEDVPFAALRGHSSWRDAKLHTRCGMGACQGRICGAATEFLFGWPGDSVRPPLFPALISSLAALPASDQDPTPAPHFNDRKEAL